MVNYKLNRTTYVYTRTENVTRKI